MKTLEMGQDKIRKICNAIRDETLEPAKIEAGEIIREARQQANQIIAEAKEQIEKMYKEAKSAIQQEKNVFQSSLQQATSQALESLRQMIERKFFDETLSEMIESQGGDPHLVANLINALVQNLEKEGLKADLTAIVPKTIDVRTVNESLLTQVVQSLKNQSVEKGDLKAGVRLKLVDRNITIDISEEALKELLATYIVRKDFREMIFKNQN